MDVISIVIRWQAFGNIRNRSIGPLVSCDQNGRQRRISTKETNDKKALEIAEEFERAATTKRTLKQVPIFIVNGSAWRVVALIGAEERLR